jgi:hypothetical protein
MRTLAVALVIVVSIATQVALPDRPNVVQGTPAPVSDCVVQCGK